MEEQKGGAMKRQHAAFALLAMVLLGCSVLADAFQGGDSGSEETEKPGAISQASTEESGDISQPGVTENPDQPPDQPTNAPIPKATNTTCNELAFFLVSTLAKAAKCETIPASGGEDAQPHETYPLHTKVTLTSYLLANRMMQPVITVFSIADYAALLPDIVNADVSDLQALIGGGTAAGDLPVLPVLNAHQLFSAQTALLQFQSGSGIGFITQYAEAYVPVNNHDLFFAYQGLTADGKYWVSVIMPISHPSLWDNRGNPANTVYGVINDNPDAYYSQQAADLNNKAPRTFVPMLSTLTDLVESILITP
jgi:hypothetical protein